MDIAKIISATEARKQADEMNDKVVYPRCMRIILTDIKRAIKGGYYKCTFGRKYINSPSKVALKMIRDTLETYGYKMEEAEKSITVLWE